MRNTRNPKITGIAYNKSSRNEKLKSYNWHESHSGMYWVYKMKDHEMYCYILSDELISELITGFHSSDHRMKVDISSGEFGSLCDRDL